MNVDGLDQEWALGKRIPTLAIFLEFLIGRDPVERLSAKRKDQLEQSSKQDKNRELFT
jgi:hypothetical protein